MEIRSIKIDFDNGILEINGKKYNRSAIVALPSEDGWHIRKMFTVDGKAVPKEECDHIELSFALAVSNTL